MNISVNHWIYGDLHGDFINQKSGYCDTHRNSGKRLHTYGKIHHAIHEKTHDLDLAIFNIIYIYICIHILNYQRVTSSISKRAQKIASKSPYGEVS